MRKTICPCIFDNKTKKLHYGFHARPLSSEGSLACHTYCDTGIRFSGQLRGPVTLAPIAERLAVELSLPAFTTEVRRD